MATITKREIIEALERLGQLASVQGAKVELALVGGALMVLEYNARGRELKAQYAFLDLWESLYGND